LSAAAILRGRNGGQATLNQVLKLLLLLQLLLTTVHAQATIAVNASMITGTYSPRFERHWAQIYQPKGPNDDALIKALDQNSGYARGFWTSQLWNPSSPGVYTFSTSNAFYFQDPQADEVVANGASPIFTGPFTPPWLADTSFNLVGSAAGTYDNEDPPKNYSQFQQMTYDGLVHIKMRYPSFQYFEVYNEPEGNWTGKVLLTLPVYERIYQACAAAVAQVNALDLPGQKIKIGGPTTSGLAQWGNTWTQPFIQWAAQNHLELDFVSYHEYDDPPIQAMTDAQKVAGWITDAGFSLGTVQVIVSEWGITSNNTCTSTPKALRLAQNAAYAMAEEYWEAQGPLSIGTIFAVNDYANCSRSVLAPKTISPTDGVPFPTYNAELMRSMLKANMVSTTEAMDSNGNGVGAVGTQDITGVAVLGWNYSDSSAGVTFDISSLPPIFFHRQIHLQQYLVDDRHSNWAFDSSAADLQKINDVMLANMSNVTQKVTMAPYSVMLFVLSPSPASGGGGLISADGLNSR
jgi:hypothetical protein